MRQMCEFKSLLVAAVATSLLALGVAPGVSVAAQDRIVPGSVDIRGGYGVIADGPPQGIYARGDFKRITSNTTIKIGIFGCGGKYFHKTFKGKTGSSTEYYTLPREKMPKGKYARYRVVMTKPGFEKFVQDEVFPVNPRVSKCRS